jgi:methyl-accepting chemotaxis protein
MRKKFLVKPALQLRHLFWTLGVVLLCFGLCYLLFESLLDSALSRGPLGQAEWLILKGHFRWGLGIGLVILLAFVGIENFLFFHNVVGPIYALERGIRRLGEGDYSDVTKIREHDEFSDVIRSFEDVKTKLISKLESHQKAALLLANELEQLLAHTSPDNIKIIKEKLKKIRDQVEKKAA